MTVLIHSRGRAGYIEAATDVALHPVSALTGNMVSA